MTRRTLLLLGTITLVCQGAEKEVIARVGFNDSVSYYLVEGWRTSRSGWIFPDVFMVGDSTGRYWQFDFGGGRILVGSKPGSRLTWVGEGYLERIDTPTTKGGYRAAPWTLLGLKLGDRWRFEGVYATFLPLNDRARIEHVVERAKLVRMTRRFEYGAGYANHQVGDSKWQHRPFGTFTIKSDKGGDVEFWVQALVGDRPGVQGQVRLHFKWGHR